MIFPGVLGTATPAPSWAGVARVTAADRARSVRAIAVARKVLPGPIAMLVVEQISWDLDKTAALVDLGRARELVDTVLGLGRAKELVDTILGLDTPEPRQLAPDAAGGAPVSTRNETGGHSFA